MGYKIKSTLKAERKLGFQSVKDLLRDPAWPKDRILQYAQQYEDTFLELDDMDDAGFVQTMEGWRQHNINHYRVFWWWRKANEDAAKKSEEDGEAKNETKYRCFEVVQFIALPWSDDWEPDRKTLKPGVEPLITQAQIEAGLDHKTIKKWAWICHDKDIYTEENEISDSTGRERAGESKFAHYDIVIYCQPPQTIRTIARWFDVPYQQVEVKHGTGAFLDVAEYLVHESPSAVEQGKTHYDDSAVHYFGFDFRKEISDLQMHRTRYGKRASEMTPSDTMRLHVMEDGWTMRECREDDPLTYSKIRSTLPPLRLDYLRDQPPASNRLTVYIEGDSDSSKTNFCRLFAKERFPDYDEAYFEAGKDQRVTFEGYDGQPAIIFNEARPEMLLEAFGYDGLYAMIDPFPGKEAYQRKGSSVILTNRLTLINSPIPWREFIQALIEPGRPSKQIYRRLQMVIVIHPEDYDVILSSGYLDKSREYDDYIEFMDYDDCNFEL